MSAVQALMAASALSTAGTAYAQSKATTAAAEYQAGIYETNKRLANIQAEDAIKRGEQEVKKLQMKKAQVIGTQRAALAAQGLDPNVDDAALIQADTAGLAAMDILDTRNNAWREAWGYKVQGEQYGQQAKFTKLTAKSQARNTLLTGGLSVAKDIASSYYLSKAKNTWSLKDLIEE